MIQVSKNPNSPFLESPRGPHFTLHTQELLRENAQGEEVYELPLQKIVDYLLTDTSDPLRIEAMALITNNNGMPLLHWKLKEGETSVGNLFSANGPLVHKDAQGNEFVDLDLTKLAVVLARGGELSTSHTIKQHITNVITSAGLVPNMDRINSEFCINCGRTK